MGNFMYLCSYQHVSMDYTDEVGLFMFFNIMQSLLHTVSYVSYISLYELFLSYFYVSCCC